MKKVIEFSGKVKSVNITTNGIEVETEDEFKKGDFIYHDDGRVSIFKNYLNIAGGLAFEYIAAFKIAKGIYVNPSYFCINETTRFATEEEKQKVIDIMHIFGKTWNDEKKCIEPYKWRAKIGEYYFCVCVLGYKIEKHTGVESNDSSDQLRYESDNYFKTAEECEKYVKEIKRLLKERPL